MLMGQLLVVQLVLGMVAQTYGRRCSKGWLQSSIGCVSLERETYMETFVSRKDSFHTNRVCHTAQTHTWG